MNDSEKLLAEAINKNELINFFRGTQKYELSKSEFVPSTIPTDTSEVLMACFQFYKKNTYIKELLEETLLKLIIGKDYDLYIATMYIFDYYLMKDRDFVTFHIELERILQQLRIELIKNREELELGIEHPDGTYYESAWSDIVRWSNVLKNRFQIEFVN